MPTYEYECTRCGHRFEEFQSITADPLEKCPKCTSPVKRLIGAGIGIIFKGSGFYTTDYKRSSAASGGSDGSKDSSNGKSESAAKSGSSSGGAESKSGSKDSSSSSSSAGSSAPASSKKS